MLIKFVIVGLTRNPKMSLRWCEALPRAFYPCRLCLH
jgi:hypothetical protein